MALSAHYAQHENPREPDHNQENVRPAQACGQSRRQGRLAIKWKFFGGSAVRLVLIGQRTGADCFFELMK